jgi:hypothetical protein
MVLQMPAPSPAVGVFLAQQLLILRTGENPSTIGVNVSRDTGNITEQGDIPATAEFPRGWWVREEGRTLLFISGCETLQHAARYVNYMGAPWSFLESGINAENYLFRAYDNYLTPFQARDVGQAGNFTVAGHSLGGALGQAVMDAARVRGIRTGQACVTFGSPKIAKRPNHHWGTGLNITRWMNNNDPVPHVPPVVVQNIAALAALNPQVLREWSMSLQLAGGVSVDPTGITDDVPTPPFGNVNLAASLSQWLWNIYQQRETVHDLPEYVRRLENVVTRTSPPASARVIASGPEPANDINRRQANAQIQAGIDAIIHVAAAQNRAQLGVPPQRAFIPIKIGPFWWVAFGNILVAVGPRRKGVGLMCRAGNQFLRRLQRMGGVDGVGLAQQLQSYIEAASVPDNGFTPTIARLD